MCVAFHAVPVGTVCNACDYCHFSFSQSFQRPDDNHSDGKSSYSIGLPPPKMFRIGSSKNKRGKNVNNYLQNEQGSTVVGTQAKAQKNLEINRQDFKYPKESFVTPIEHSLIYSMIQEGPEVYPEDVVLKHIEDEDFTIYMPVQQIDSMLLTSTSTSTNHHRVVADTIDDLATHKVSYAQLSAILALAGEKFKPQKGRDKPNSIPQKLCQKVLNCVVAYAKRYDLDREAEIKELLEPVEKRLVKTATNQEIRDVLPFYLGYTASLITLNPLPMIVGFTVMTQNSKNGSENLNRNLNQITKATERRSNEEQTSLLDEQEDF